MSDYKYQNGTLSKSFYYMTNDGTEIWGGLNEDETLALVSPAIRDYVVEAIQYWKENNYFSSKDTSVFVFSNEVNIGCIFVRFDKGSLPYYNQVSQVHISRFIVENKGNGFGSNIVRWFQQFNRRITLWSNQEAIKFYEKNGFKFDFDKFNDVEGHGRYTWGEWNKK